MDNANEADAREMLIRRNLIGGFILLAISVLFMIEVRLLPSDVYTHMHKLIMFSD